MTKYTTQNSIDFDDLMKNATPVTPEAEPAPAPKAAADPAVADEDDDLIVEDEETIALPKRSPVREEDVPTTSPKEYTGPGAVVDKQEFLAGKAKSEGVPIRDVQPETIEGAKKWMSEADEQITELKKKKAEMEAKGIQPPIAATTPQSVVNIYLDRAQLGMLSLTPDQQKKVEFASKIVINETHEEKFRSIKIRRIDLKDKNEAQARKNTIIKKAFDRTLAPFVLCGSGYLGKMGNCSVAEIIKIGDNAANGGRSLSTELERWQLLYDKMKYCSIGKFKTFDDFLKHTAYDDYSNLQFALICASFPDTTTMQVTCPKCGNVFTVTVKNKELIRTERVDEDMAQNIKNIIDSDTFLERAMEVHENAPFNKISRIPVNDEDDLILLDLYAPSAYDAIYRTYRDLTDERKNDDSYDGYVSMLTMVRAAYLGDEDENGELVYDEFTEPNDIFNILTQLTEPQVRKISNYMTQSYMNHKYTYGIKQVVCPNPECKNDMGEFPMSMDNLLFLKVRAQ